MAQDTAPKSPPAFDWKAFTPEDSPKTPMDLMADSGRQALSSPDLAVGDRAYDFELPVYDFGEGSESATGETFHLGAVAEKSPVALVFGSYT